jgi:Domain of unknown function (DUF4037)
MPFLPGLELSARFYREVVAPLLGDLPHAAARIGPGSEVLGFDTERSTDHDWGPRLQLFLTRPHETLAGRLPATFLGWPTDGVEFTDLSTWFGRHLGFDPRAGVTVSDWLGTPTQTLAEVTAGAVFHDGLGELAPARECLAWYPTDVWRYVLASQWSRIAEEEAFVGRCGEVGDELGSAVVAARLVRDLMRLCLLIHRRYPPYGKWLGSAFARLPDASALTPVLTAALAATEWHVREHHLAAGYRYVAGLQNGLELAEPVDPATRPYYDRPYQVLGAARFAAALVTAIADAEIRRLPLIGAIDQYVDNTLVLSNVDQRRSMPMSRAGAECVRAPTAR